MSNILSIKEAKTLNIQVASRETVENIVANFDVCQRSENPEEAILETQYLDELSGDHDQLIGLLGVEDPKQIQTILDADFLCLYA
jgi:hypothetical protein